MGLFAARSFQSGSTLTKYIGKTTKSKKTKDRWLTKPTTKHYILELKNKETFWVAPNGSGMYGHRLNHADEPNCEFDMKTGVITSMYVIQNGEELTLNYNLEYFIKNWK